jgi:DENN domain-containing protein 5
MFKQRMNHDICKLQRQIENRLCADCNDTLLRNENTYASLKPAVFICSKCYVIHKRVLPTDFTTFKSLSDDWDEEELAIMRNGGGNIERNKVWERYIPSSNIINKPVPDSNDKDREIWIKAKYFIKMFLVPQPQQQLDHFSSFSTISEVFDKKSKANLLPSSPLDYLPTRILDFYLVIGQGKFKAYEASRGASSSSSAFEPERTYFSPCIFSSFPKADHYTDMAIPDMVSHIVFPKGLTYSSQDHPPQSFSLVLTDISRVKIYCVVLLTYELVEPQKVDEVIHVIKKQHQIDLSNELSTVYAPKALVILSHYPFYNFFSSALKQLYHISLSSSPLPLERYIANLVNDVPLPPQGLTEVVFSLVDTVFQIRRPPPNQLPMIDFSYRPLFMMLSIDNILSIFRCMLNEYSLCFYSSNIALLTPIQEAFMSLLFPFVWQGVYIPILERSVIDIIDAPVPYVLGVLKDLLLSIPMANRMDESNTVFVDIDNDRLSFDFNANEPLTSTSGSEGDPISPKATNSRPTSKLPSTDLHFLNELNQRIPQLPVKATSKLREKLIEFGGVIHRSMVSIDIITKSSLAYPSNEHLVPLPDDAFFDRGVAKKEFSVNLTSNEPKSKSNSKHGASQRQPVISTLVSYFSIPLAETKRSIFDPRNNADYGDNFDAREIRGAFLRFFVACMQGYNDYIANKSKASASEKGTISLKESIVNAIPSRSKPPTGGGASSVMSYEQGNEALSKDDEDFLKQLAKSQMFCNFEEEKRSNPTQPELIFFDESIIEKQNRSLHIFSKKQTTPFLDDRRYEIHESYSCPGPSTWKIDHQQRFRYEQYPMIDLESLGPLATRKILVQHAEIKRISAASHQSNDVLESIHEKYRSSGNFTVRDRAASSSNKLIDADEYLVSNYRRLQRINRAISTFHIIYRYRKRIRVQYRRVIAAIKLQCSIRIYFGKKLLRQWKSLRALEAQVKKIVLVQSFLRMCAKLLRYQRIRSMLIRMQSYLRMRKHRLRFQRQRRMVVRLQSHVRGYLIRIKEQKKLRLLMNQYCQQLLLLWSWERTPLFHRSACWSILRFQKTSMSPHRFRYLDRGLCEEELLRIYSSLDLYHHNSIRIKASMSFVEKFLAVDRDGALKQLAIASDHSKALFNAKEIRSSDAGLSSQAKAAVKANLQREENERKAIYLVLKQTAENAKDQYYLPFGLQREKKRKQTLSNMLWMHNHLTAIAEIDASTKIVTELHTASEANLNKDINKFVDVVQFSGIELRRQNRVRAAVLEVARSNFLTKNIKAKKV